MTQNKIGLIEDLNKLFKGAHKGSGVFKEYLLKTTAPELQTLLSHALDIFNHYEVSIAKHLAHLNGEKEDDLGILASINEFVEKIKTIVIDSDGDIVTHATQALDYELKEIQTFFANELILPESIKNTIDQLELDYKALYEQFSDYRIHCA